MASRKAAVLVAAALILSGIQFTGAFTSVTADRTVAVDVAGDRDAFLALQPGDSADGAHAKVENGQLELVFDGSAPDVSGDGLNPSATTGFGDVFNVTNQGTQPVNVSVEDGSSRAHFSVGDVRVDDDTGAVTLEPGETAAVDVTFETGSDAALENLSSITIAANATSETTNPPTEDPPGGTTPGGAQVTRVDANTQQVAATTLAAGTSTSFDLQQTQNGRTSGVTVENFSIATTNDVRAAPTVRQPDVPDGGVPSVPNESARVLSYFAVDHPNLTASDIAGANFTVTVQKSAVDGPPANFTVVRYHDGTWNQVNTTLVAETEQRYTFRVQSPGLSFLTALWDAGTDYFGPEHKRDDAIKSVDIVDTTDFDDDGRVSSFAVRVRANTTLRGLDPSGPSEPTLSVAVNGLPVETQDVSREEDGVYTLDLTFRHLNWTAHEGENRVTVTLRDSDEGELAEFGGDKADAVDRTVDYEPLRSEADITDVEHRLVTSSKYFYEKYDERYLSKSFWNENAEEDADFAAANLQESIGEVMPTVPTTGAAAGQMAGERAVQRNFGSLGSRALAGYSAAKIFLHGSVAAVSMYGAVHKKAIAIHLDRPEYTAGSYARLHENLSALRNNSEQLQTAIREGDEVREQALIEERLQLLQSLRTTLPDYQSDYYRSVSRYAAGGEDMNAYRTVWVGVNALRMHVRSDYAATRSLLGNRPASLSTSQMPTHGWQFDDHAVVYDTLETSDDWTTYRVRVPEESVDDQNVTLRLEGSSVETFTTKVGSTPPTDGRLPGGVAMTDYHPGLTNSMPSVYRKHTITKPGTYYLTVRATGKSGGYQLTADANVSITPLARHGPDVQRPVLTLVDAPPARDLTTGHTVYATNDSHVSLTWRTWDDKTPTSDLRYSVRVDNGSGFSEWSSWQPVDENGRIHLDYAFADGLHRVQIRLLDDANQQAVQNVDVVVSKFTPQAAIAAPDDSTSPRFGVRVLPDRRVDSVTVQYRPVGNDTWQTWRVINDTQNLGLFTFNHTGQYQLRARATTLTGDHSAWARTNITYSPPDTDAPELDLMSGPSVDTFRNGTHARVTGADTVNASWSVTPQDSAASEIEYRVGVDDAWGSWQALPDNETVRLSRALAAGTHELRVQVRDSAGNQNAGAVSVRVDRTSPAAVLHGASGAVEEAVFNITASEAVASLDVQYYANGTWHDGGSLPHAGHTSTPLPTGTHDVRVRPVDYAGNTGSWTRAVTVNVAPAESSTYQRDYDRELNDDDDTTLWDGSGGGSGGGGGSSGSVNVGVSQLTGDVLLNFYMETREGRSVDLKTVRFTRRGNQTVALDLPGDLQNASLHVQMEGNGTVVLKSLRLFDATPPTPTLHVTPSTPTVGHTVRLNATDLGPRDATRSVTWTVAQNDTESTFDGQNVTWTPANAGDHTVEVRRTDIFGASSTNRTTVSVNARPTAVVNTTTTAPVYTAESVTLTAANSTDRENASLEMAWDVDDDGTYERTGATTSVSFADNGTYPVTVRVTDDLGATDTATSSLAVHNRPPTARATHTPDVPVTGESVTFDARESGDPDGEVASAAWDFNGDGVDAHGMRVDHRFASGGNHTVTLTVTDDDGTRNTTTFTVYVNRPPTADIAVPTSVLTGETARLDASASSDPDENALDYAWTINDTPVDASTDAVRRTFADDGNYTVSVTVTDTYGASDSATKTVTVRNRPPNARASTPTDVPVVGTNTTFEAGQSTDSDGRVTSYAWDFDGDERVDARGGTVAHAFSTAGNHTVMLTVTDDDGSTNTTTLTVDVNAPPNPTIDLPGDVLTHERATLDARGSSDPDGNIVSTTWNVTSSVANPSAPNTSTTFADDGNYTIAVSVTDDRGTRRSASRTLRVHNRPPNASFTLRTNATDTSVNPGQRVDLLSTASDRDGDIARTTWQVDGDVVGNESQSGVVFDAPGNHTLALTVTDDDGATDTVTRTVHVNAPPTVSFTPPNGVVTATVGEPLTLNASGTTDPDGDDLTYVWATQTETLTVTTTPTVTVPTLNSTTGRALLTADELRLTVWDTHGASTTVTRTLSSSVDDDLLTVTGPETLETGENDTYRLSQTLARLGVETVNWSVPTADSESGVLETHYGRANESWTATVGAFKSDGTRALTAAVTTTWGAHYNITQPIEVTEPAGDMVAIETNATTRNGTVAVQAGHPVRFSANVTAPSRTIDVVDWVAASDNASMRGDSLVATYASTGSRTVWVNVTFADGSAVSTTRTVTVEPAIVQTEAYVSTMFGGRIVVGQAYTFGDTAFSPGLSVAWDTDRDGTYESAGATFVRHYTSASNATFRFRATDEEGDTRTWTENVSVDPAANVSVAWQARGSLVTVTDRYAIVNTGVEQTSTANTTSSIVAYHRSNGTQAWEITDIDTSADGGVTVVDTAVFARTASQIVRVNLTTGVRAWSQPAESGWGLHATQHTVVTSENGTLVARNADDGTVRWRHTLNESLYLEDVSTDHVIVSGYDPERVQLLDVESGHLVRQLQGNWRVVAAGQPTYLANENTIAAVGPDGTMLWSYNTTRSTQPYDAVVSNGVVYTPTERGTVIAVTDTGRQWESEPLTENSWSLSLSAGGDRIAVATDSAIGVLDADTGTLAWRHDSDYSPEVHIRDDTLFVAGDLNGDNVDDLARIDAATGTVNWRIRSENLGMWMTRGNSVFVREEPYTFRVTAVAERTETDSRESSAAKS